MAENPWCSLRSHHRSVLVWSASEEYSIQTEQLLLAAPIHEVEVQEEVEAVASAIPVLQTSSHEVEVQKELVEVSLPVDVLEEASLPVLPLSRMDREQMQPEV